MSRRISVCVLLFGLTAVAVTTQQPGTCGPLLSQCLRICESVQPALASIAPNTGSSE